MSIVASQREAYSSTLGASTFSRIEGLPIVMRRQSDGNPTRRNQPTLDDVPRNGPPSCEPGAGGSQRRSC